MDGLGNLILLGFGFTVLAFMILSQSRKAKEQRDMHESLAEGDEVVLTSGIHGFVNSLESNVIWVEVAEGTELKVSRASVASVVVDSEVSD